MPGFPRLASALDSLRFFDPHFTHEIDGMINSRSPINDPKSNGEEVKRRRDRNRRLTQNLSAEALAKEDERREKP
jgi:hypothetical protein